MAIHQIARFSNSGKSGFTLIELLVTIAILAIVIAIGVPSLSTFIVKMRVDSQIAEINRLILTARNTAINSGKYVTVCPLAANQCTNNWQNQVSVFINSANDFDNAKAFDANNEDLIKVKNADTSGDTTKSNTAQIIYAPTGRLVQGATYTINYCPKSDASLSRGITVTASGRTYISQDTDNDGKDEDRGGNEISCT
ncbi:GspH/FimT family pseudopilin [Colwellia sp. MEBiC06753]